MTEKKEKKPPTHEIFQVIGDTDAAYWIKVGAGWANKDGKGISLSFNAYPITGRTVIRQVELSVPAAE